MEGENTSKLSLGRARLGVAISVRDTPSGMVVLTLDDVQFRGDVRPPQWVIRGIFTEKEFPLRAFLDGDLEARDYEKLGRLVALRLVAQRPESAD